MKSSFFADRAKESKAKDVRTDVDIAEIKNELKKHIYRAQVELGLLKFSIVSYSSLVEPKYNNNSNDSLCLMCLKFFSIY